MKKLNIKLILILIGSTFFCTTSVFFLHRWQVNRNADLLVKRADEAFAKGDFRAAEHHRKRYLVHRRDDVEQRINWVHDLKAILDLENWSSLDLEKVFYQYDNTLRKIGRNTILRRELIDLAMDPRYRRDSVAAGHVAILLDDLKAEVNEYLEQGKAAIASGDTDTAIQMYRKSAAINPKPEVGQYNLFNLAEDLRKAGVEPPVVEKSKDGLYSPELEILLATTQARGIDYRKAANSLIDPYFLGYDESTKSFDQKDARAIHEVDAYLLLSQIYRSKLSNTDHADRLMDQVVVANPESFRAHLARGQYLMQWYPDDEQRKKQAHEEIAKATELEPNDSNVILISAEFELLENRLSKAREILSRGIEMYPENELIYLSHIKLSIQEGNPAEAMELAKRGLKNVEDSRKRLLLWMRGNLELDQRDYAAVRRTMKELEEIGFRSQLVDYFDAMILVFEGKYAEGARYLEKLRPDLIGLPLTGKIDRFLAECYWKLGQPDRALVAILRVLEVNKDDVDAQRKAARYEAAIGKIDNAEERLGGIDPGEVTLQQKLSDQERMIRMKIAEQKRLPKASQDWTGVYQELAKFEAEEEFPETRKIILRTDVFLQHDRWADANKTIEVGLRKHVDDMQLWFVAANLTAHDPDPKRGPGRALDFMDSIEKKFGDSMAVRLNRAEFYVMQGGADVKQKLAALEQDIEDFEQLEKIGLWRGLGTHYYRLRDFEQTRRLWKLIADNQPEDVAIRVSLFEMSQEAGDDARMAEMLDEIESLVGQEDSRWQIAQATHLVWRVRNNLVEKSTLTSARKILRDIRANRPRWHKISQLEADIFLIENDVDSAIAKLQQSLEEGPARTGVVSQLAEMLLQRGRASEANRALNELDAAQLDSIRLLRSKVYAAQNDLAKAIPLALENSQESKTVESYLWLGQLLSRAKQYPQAENSIRQAITIAPENEELLIALIKLLVLQNKKDQAEDEIRKTQLVLDESKSSLVMGQCYQLMGDMEQASRYYMMALQIDPNNPSVLRKVVSYHLAVNDAAEAARHLSRMIEGAPKNGPVIYNDLAWARRTMARLLASTKNHANYLEAQALLEDNVPTGGEMLPEDLLLSVTFASQRSDPSAHQNAIAKLKEKMSRRKLTSSENLILAQLYEKTGRWAECQSLMTTLLAGNEKNTELVGTYIQMLLRNGQAGQVDIWLKNLDSNSLGVRILQVHAMVQQGKIDDGIRQVYSFLPKDLSTDNYSMLKTSAILFEELAGYDETEQLYAEAEKVYRAYVKAVPQQRLILAEFLGRRGKVAEAFDICKQAKEQEGVSDKLIRVAMSMVSENRDKIENGSPIIDQLTQWFDTASQSDPNSKRLLYMKALLEETRGNPDGAMVIYEQYLQRPDVRGQEMAIVKNNLAFILAMRNDGKRSFDLIQQSIQELGPTPDLLDTRAMAYLAQGEFDNAIADLIQAISADKSAVKYFHLALAHYMKGSRQAAESALQNARKQGLKLEDLSTLERQKYQQLVEDLRVADAR